MKMILLGTRMFMGGLINLWDVGNYTKFNFIYGDIYENCFGLWSWWVYRLTSC